MKGSDIMKRKFKKTNCPNCGKELINLNHEVDGHNMRSSFWCDECDIDITIDTYDDESEDD